MILALTMLFSLTVSASAANTAGKTNIVDIFEMSDAADNDMRFELVENSQGNYTLHYYMNDELVTSYDMSVGCETITARSNKTRSTYTLEAAEPVEVAALQNQPIARVPDRWAHVGYIKYQYSSKYDCEPWAVISCKDTDSYVGSYVVDTYQNSCYSDWVATITSTIITFCVAMYAPATIAAEILSAMIGLVGADVINDFISIPFRDEYNCSSVTYTMRAQVMGPGVDDTDKVDYEGGVEYWITYDDAPDFDRVYEGWTPGNWRDRDFAEEVWADSVPWWPAFPGVSEYTLYL